MAEGDRGDSNVFRGMGKARALLQAIEDFRIRKERGQGPPRIHGGGARALGVNRGHMERRPGGVTVCNLQG